VLAVSEKLLIKVLFAADREEPKFYVTAQKYFLISIG